MIVGGNDRPAEVWQQHPFVTSPLLTFPLSGLAGGLTGLWAATMHLHLGSPLTMTSSGKSLRDPCTLEEEGPPSPFFLFLGWPGVTVAAPANRTRPDVNLQKDLHVGSWTIWNLLDDDRLPFLSNDLRGLKVDVVALSETHSGEISGGGTATTGPA